MYLIGIDPGAKGGIAILRNGKFIAARELGVCTLIPKTMIELMKEHMPIDSIQKEDILFVVEKVGAMPGQGVSSMFTFGFNVGIIHGALISYELPFILTPATVWKKALSIPGKKDIQSCKKATIEAVHRRYPATRNIPYHSGIYDAILIASWANERKRI